MAKKHTKSSPNPAGRKGQPLTLSPLTPDQAIAGIFQIKPDDVERIIGKTSKARPKKK